jgi:hypothetical protein
VAAQVRGSKTGYSRSNKVKEATQVKKGILQETRVTWEKQETVTSHVTEAAYYIVDNKDRTCNMGNTEMIFVT